MSSSRVQMTFTGAFTAFETCTASRTKWPSITRAAAETAAKQRRVNLHLFGLETGNLNRPEMVEGLPLRAGPDVAAVGPDVGDAVQRLHRRVGQVR